MNSERKKKVSWWPLPAALLAHLFMLHAGIDAGGLFKDFWTDISNRVFNPSFGLFSLTESHVSAAQFAMYHILHTVFGP